MVISAMVLTMLGASGLFAPPGNFYNAKAGSSNSPGLTCRTVTVVSVYEQPSLSAKVIGRTQNFIAVTGEEVNGFVPMVTGRRVRGWVQSAETTTGKRGDLRGPCIVQMQPDGRLLFGWP